MNILDLKDQELNIDYEYSDTLLTKERYFQREDLQHSRKHRLGQRAHQRHHSESEEDRSERTGHHHVRLHDHAFSWNPIVYEQLVLREVL